MVFNIEDVPKIGLKDWSLSITGEVKNRCTFSYLQLKNDFPSRGLNSNLLCLRGVSIKGFWSGVSVEDLLDKAEPDKEAKWIEAKAYSGYSEPVKLRDLVQEAAIVAFSLDGEQIPDKQGGYLRLIVPNKYAYKSVKWLNELKLRSQNPSGFWEKKGYPLT